MASEQRAALQKKLSELRRDGEERDARRTAARTGLSYIDLRTTPVSLDAIRLVPEDEAKEARMACVELKARSVAVAVQNPEREATKKSLATLSAKGYAVKIFVTSLSGLEQAWHFYQFVVEDPDKITGKVTIDKKRLEGLAEKIRTIEDVRKEIDTLGFQKLATTEFLEIVLSGAMANRASDIHFEAGDKASKLRFRIDGALHDIHEAIPAKHYSALASRIKLLSGLKINIRTEAQDGRFTIGLTSKEVEMRVSIIPSEYGETIVMRILDPDSINIGLDVLGLRDDDLVIVRKSLSQPNGLILNTGPTGSGKTTTLYAFLRDVNKPDVKIITIEDPVEYHLGGIEQTQVNPGAGYTFASGLRSILRQDPDVILVGEIRDRETADIALQAALTGHIVFSTLHTNDSVGAVPRLIDLGVNAVSIGPALNLVIAQRLVRKLCDACKKPVTASAELARKIKKFISSLPPRVNRAPYEKPTLFEPGGCAECNTIGFRGRRGIFEFFEGGTELEKVIISGASGSTLQALAKKQQMVTMQQDGILKVLGGITTISEVESITGPVAW